MLAQRRTLRRPRHARPAATPRPNETSRRATDPAAPKGPEIAIAALPLVNVAMESVCRLTSVSGEATFASSSLTQKLSAATRRPPS